MRRRGCTLYFFIADVVEATRKSVQAGKARVLSGAKGLRRMRAKVRPRVCRDSQSTYVMTRRPQFVPRLRRVRRRSKACPSESFFEAVYQRFSELRTCVYLTRSLSSPRRSFKMLIEKISRRSKAQNFLVIRKVRSRTKLWMINSTIRKCFFTV